MDWEKTQFQSSSEFQQSTQELWPRPFISEYLGEPPALEIALIISLDHVGLITLSFSPCQAQMGIWISFFASDLSPPPQIGTAAAK